MPGRNRAEEIPKRAEGFRTPPEEMPKLRRKNLENSEKLMKESRKKGQCEVKDCETGSKDKVAYQTTLDIQSVNSIRSPIKWEAFGI